MTSRVTKVFLARTGSPAADPLLVSRVADQLYAGLRVVVVAWPNISAASVLEYVLSDDI